MFDKTKQAKQQQQKPKLNKKCGINIWVSVTRRAYIALKWVGLKSLREVTEVTSAWYSCVLFSQTFVLESQNPVLWRRYERWPYFGEMNQVEKEHGKSRCQFQALGLFLAGPAIWMNEQLNSLGLHFESLLVLGTAEITDSIPNLFAHAFPNIIGTSLSFVFVCYFQNLFHYD